MKDSLFLVTVTGVYAGDISQSIKSFINKTPVYSSTVDGSAYYLKDSYKLNENIKLISLIFLEGNLEIDLISDLSHKQLGKINIIPKKDSKTIYEPGGYSESEDGKESF